MRETLEDMETWVRDIVEKGESLMDGNRVARIKTLIGNSYKIVSEKALKDENLQKWRNSTNIAIPFRSQPWSMCSSCITILTYHKHFAPFLGFPLAHTTVMV